MWTNPGNIQIGHRHMNVEIRTEAVLFPEKEYKNGIFLAVLGSRLEEVCQRVTAALVLAPQHKNGID